MVGKLLANGAAVTVYFPDQRAGIVEECRYALDFPLQSMLEEYRRSEDIGDREDAERNQLLNTWLKSALVLVSHGAIWDIDFSEWRGCLEKAGPDFSQREAKRLDEMRQVLEENNRASSLEPHKSTSGPERRISYMMRPFLRR